jgi:Tol biopolymer transport system component
MQARHTSRRHTHARLPGALAAVATALASVLLAPSASASPPGSEGRLVYTHWTSADTIEDVHRLEPDGSNETTLLSTPAVSNRDPEWSPDRTRVAFHRGDEFGTVTGLWTTDAEGGDLTPVPNTDGGFGATWAPDGQHLAFVCPDPVGGDTEICTVALDGTDLQVVTDTAGVEGGPAWAPDGSEIAFSRTFSSETGAQLVATDPATLTERTVTPAVAGRWSGGPAFSPRGDRLAFSRLVVGSGEGEAIYVSRTDGTHARLVTAPAAGSGLHHTTPAWSPRGHYLAFSEAGDDGESGHLFTVRWNGTGLTQLTSGDRTDLDPSWR